MNYIKYHGPKIYKPGIGLENYYDRMLKERPQDLETIVSRYKKDPLLFNTFVERILNSGYAESTTIDVMTTWLYSGEFKAK